MGFQKEKRPLHRGGSAEAPQTLTQATTATRVNGYGTTIIVSSGPGDKTFILRQPIARGTRKTILADVNSSGDVFVITHSTAITLYGTTHATIRFTTGAAAGVHLKRAELIAATTTRWALLTQSTGVTTQA